MVEPLGEEGAQDAFSAGSGAAATLKRVFSFAGTPAISVPCGQDEECTPLGLQIVGKPFHEQNVLRVAARFERARAWDKSAHNRVRQRYCALGAFLSSRV